MTERSVNLSQDEMGELLDSLRDKDETAFHRWTKSEAWATVEQLLDANGILCHLPLAIHRSGN